MPTPKELGYPRLPRGAGTIYWNKGKWEGRWRGKGAPPDTFRDADYMTVYSEMNARHQRRQQGFYVAPADLTIRDLVETYIERRIAYNKWKPSTINLHQRNARLHIYPLIGHLRLLSVDETRLQHWIDQLARTLKPNSINACTSLLAAAYNQTSVRKIVPDNPCRHLDHPKPLPITHTIWSVEEIRRVLEVLRDEPRWLAVYQVMLSTGMRPGELRTLVWSDIDFAAGRIRIARTLSQDATGHLIVGKDTKSGLTRYVPLTAGPRAALLAWQSVQVRRSLDASQDWIFPGTKGQPMSRGMWDKRHARLATEANVPLITFHQLRHTSGSQDMAAGTPLKVVSERLGHKDPAFTARVYQHVSVDLQQAAADALDERLFGGKTG